MAPDDDVFVSASQLTAAIAAADIATRGTAQVTVANPAGAVSNALTFTITAAATYVPVVQHLDERGDAGGGVEQRPEQHRSRRAVPERHRRVHQGHPVLQGLEQHGPAHGQVVDGDRDVAGLGHIQRGDGERLAGSTVRHAGGDHREHDVRGLVLHGVGIYSVTVPYFTSQVSSPPLRALANGDGGGNGLYRYGAGGGFPTSTFNSANYWVDVVFTTTAPPPPPCPTTGSTTYHAQDDFSGFQGCRNWYYLYGSAARR